MRCLIIANERDYTANAVAQLLRQRHGPHAVQLRSVRALVQAPHWEHELRSTGIRSCVRLNDGTSLSDFCPSVILNRMQAADVPMHVFRHPRDREYGRLEWGALLLSWLNSLDILVVNAPTAQSLSGGALRIGVWYQLALRAGLRVLPLFATTSPREFPPARGYDSSADGALGWYGPPLEHGCRATDVVGSATFDAPSKEISEGCQRLAELAQVQILRVLLRRTRGAQGAWLFHSASTMPQINSPDRLVALADLLERGARLA